MLQRKRASANVQTQTVSIAHTEGCRVNSCCNGPQVPESSMPRACALRGERGPFRLTGNRRRLGWWFPLRRSGFWRCPAVTPAAARWN